MLTDTHCHLFADDYENLDTVITNSINNGVGRFINNATDKNSCKEALKLANSYPSMFVALGIHPEYVDMYDNTELDYIEQNLNNKKVIAIGEIGLDYYYNKENKEKQIQLFESQLKLAEKYHLPVIIHNREATNDIIYSLKKYKVKGVIHCFNGSIEIARELIKMGFALGINGVVTFKNCKLKETLKNIPIVNIVLETDCPYLTPEPNRGKKNEPKYVKDIADFVSKIYEIPVSQVEKITNENIRRIFDI